MESMAQALWTGTIFSLLVVLIYDSQKILGYVSGVLGISMTICSLPGNQFVMGIL
jgi:hypothetical protein